MEKENPPCNVYSPRVYDLRTQRKLICFLFVHCILRAGGKCQEIIQGWKLILNDCHLLAILLLSWGRPECGDVLLIHKSSCET